MASVFDASALLAVLLDEPGATEMPQLLQDGGMVSAVNLAEVLSKLSDLGVPEGRALQAIAEARLDVRPFDERQARRAAGLRAFTRHLGLTLGDRACLALAQTADLPAVTADRGWARLEFGVAVVVIR